MDDAQMVHEMFNTYGPSWNDRIRFAWNGKHADGFVDANLAFRRKVCDYLVKRKAEAPLQLVADLYTAEVEYAKEAWGVSRVVSVLAQEMLERGGAQFLETYAHALRCGMDAGLESGRIVLSEPRRQELLAFCEAKAGIEHHPDQRIWAYLVERFKHLGQQPDPQVPLDTQPRSWWATLLLKWFPKTE